MMFQSMLFPFINYSKCITGCLLIIVINTVVQSQNNRFKEPIPPTPTAASLGKYGDIPVSYHTGVPNISVPIHTIQEGDLTVPVSLSYHSSGIKVDEIASWVGLGWSLNAGGMITRTIMGAPDEGVPGNQISGTPMSSVSGWGYYKDGGLPPGIYDCGSPNPNCWCVGSTCGTGECDCKGYYWDASFGWVDLQPDLFTFNFGNYSGKFVFDENGNVLTIPKEDLYIKPIIGNPYFEGWEVITPDGTKYEFGGFGAIENSYTQGQGIGGSLNEIDKTGTTWYLKRIVSKNGNHRIEFNYEAENYSYANRPSQTVVFGTSCTLVSGVPDQAPSNYFVLNNVEGLRLKSIISSSGNVEIRFIPSSGYREDLSQFLSYFYLNDEAKYLDRIEISGKEVCKTYELTHSYFISGSASSNPEFTSTSQADLKRLKLESVQEFSCDQQTSVPPYQFTYETSITMARRFSLGRDHWGYYNGYDNNSAYIPDGWINPCNGNPLSTNSFRDANEINMKAWTLNEIKYPTGGTSIFTYEAHRESGTSAIVGGLRIKSIRNIFGNGDPDVVRDFMYGTGHLYQGIIDYNADPDDNQYSSYNPYLGVMVTGSPKPGLQSPQGYHIGYTQVTVTQTGNGSQVYSFTNVTPIPEINYPDPPAKTVIGAGMMVEDRIKDESAITLKISAKSQDYNTIMYLTPSVAVTTATVPDQPSDFDNTYVLPTIYDVESSRYRLSSESVTLDGVTRTTSYEYSPTDEHNFPIAITLQDSKGIQQRTEYIYAGDPGSGAPGEMWDALNANYKHQISEVIEEKTLYDGNLRKRKVNNYSYDITNDFIFLNSTQLYPSGTSVVIEDFYQYNAEGNLVGYKPQDDAHISFIWDHNNTYPIAKVANANTDVIAFTGFETTETGNWSIDIPTSNLQLTETITSGSFTIDVNQNVDINFTIDPALADPVLVFTDQQNNQKEVLLHGSPKTINLDPETYSVTLQEGAQPLNTATVDITYIATYPASTSSFTGNKSLNIGSLTLSKTNLPVGEYLISYATDGTINVTINGAGSVQNLLSQNLIGSWNLEKKKISISDPTDIIELTGTGLIDELRLHPVNSVMTTYSYSPGEGIITTSDNNFITTHYRYDDLSRLRLAKDKDLNILRKINYKYAGQ